MERIRQARTAGTIGIVVSVFWLVEWAIEAFVDPSIGSPAWYLTQTLATALLLGTAVLMFGLAALHPAGDGRAARTVVGLNWVAWLSLTVGGIGFLIQGNEDNGPLAVFFPIGGILGTLSLLVSGILVAVKRRLLGWQRWAVLIFGIGYLLLGFFQGSDKPTTASQAAELVQYLLLGLLAVAVRTATTTTTQPSTEPARV